MASDSCLCLKKIQQELFCYGLPDIQLDVRPDGLALIITETDIKYSNF